MNELTDGAFTDQLLGQWWAYILDLGDLLPADHVATAVAGVFGANHRDGFNPADQHPRKFYDERDSGLYVATWPDSKPPPKPLLYTSEAAWSGIEYPMAGLALACGTPETDTVWKQMLLDTRARQDGTRRSVVNEIECGQYYSRPMSGFALLELAAGIRWNKPALQMTIAPRVLAADGSFCGWFTTDSGWG